MEGAGWTRVAVGLGGLAIGAIVSIFTSQNYVGGPITAAVFGAAAARCWYLGG
jgi:hypothetical protein